MLRHPLLPDIHLKFSPQIFRQRNSRPIFRQYSPVFLQSTPNIPAIHACLLSRVQPPVFSPAHTDILIRFYIEKSRKICMLRLSGILSCVINFLNTAFCLFFVFYNNGFSWYCSACVRSYAFDIIHVCDDHRSYTAVAFFFNEIHIKFHQKISFFYRSSGFYL